MENITPLHIAENLSDLETIAKNADIFKSKNTTKTQNVMQNAIKTLYKNILKEKYDQEKCYLLCVRFDISIQKMIKMRDEKFVRIMYKSEIVKVREKMDELRPVLEKRYQELQNLKRKPRLTNTSKTKPSINDPIGYDLFSAEFISCSQLYHSIEKQKNILLVDVRPETEFNDSHITYRNIINIPGDILVPGLSAHALTKKLKDAEAKQKWEKRDAFDALVFVDWDTVSENIISPKLNVLKLAVMEWDCLRNYKQHPVILRGGFREFFESYPNSVSNVHVNYIRRNEDIDELLELDSISYPDTSVPVMNLKEFTIEKLEESLKTDDSFKEQANKVVDIVYTDIDKKLDNKESVTENIVIPKGGEYIPDLFPDSEEEKEVEEIKEFNKEPLPTIQDTETRNKLLAEARKLKRKLPGFDNKENTIPEGPVGDISIENYKRPPPVRRETKPQKLETNRGWCGIYNIRNICYMSTIMQCLKCIPIIKKICDPTHMDTIKLGRRPPAVFYEFCKMVFTLWDGTDTDIKVIRPYPFYNTVCKLDDTYGKGKHEDCMEFFLFLLNHLNDDCSFEIPKPGVMIDKEIAWYNHLQGRSSFWVDLFYHQFKCTKVCKVCSTKAVTFETDNTLMLSVPHQTKFKRIHMNHLIEEYMEDSHIMDYKCSKCQEMRVVNTKSVVVAPEILVIVLKRYYQDEYRDMKKNNIPVNFDTNLVFGSFSYELCSVAQHMGTIDVGHYFAAGQIPDGWVQFNDERVTPLGDLSGLAVTACAFFYTKQKKLK